VIELRHEATKTVLKIYRIKTYPHQADGTQELSMRKSGGFKNCWWLVIMAAGFAGASLLAQDVEQTNEPLRNRVYALRNITVGQAQAYLERLKLGTTISQIPQSNALIVTAPPADLVKVSTVIDMVDSKQTFVIDRLGPAGMAVPSAKAIMERLPNVSVGSFVDPPSHAKKLPAVLDVQAGNTVLISPEGESDRIIKVINELKAAGMVSTARPAEAAAVKEALPKTVPAPKVAEANKVRAAQPAAPAEVNQEESLNKEVNELLSEQKQPPTQPKEAEQLKPKEAQMQPAVPPLEAAPEKQAQTKEGVIEARKEYPTEPTGPAPPEVPGIAEPTSIPHGEEELQLQLPETVDVVALLDLVGKYLNINYLYDPTRVNGTVTLKIRGPIKVSELYTVTESVLKFKGFAMSRRDNLVTIVPVADAPAIDPTIVTNGEKLKPGDIVVTAAYNLKYVNVQSAMGLLTNMKMGTSLYPVAESNTLIVTDYAYRIERIDKLIEMIDQPGAPKLFKFRDLKYTLASALVPKIQAIAQQIGSETINVQVGAAAAAPTRPGYRTPTRPGIRPQPVQPAAGQAGQPTIYLDYDERTNRLLMVGQEKEIELIEQLVDSFDVPQQELRTIKEYEIQYVDAREVTNTLTTLGIISGTGLGTTGTVGGARIPSPAQAAPGQAGSAAGTPLEEPQIAVLESTNSLLVNATPEQQAAIVMVISYVDRQPAEVAIPYVVYPLEFQKPSELKPVLTELIEKTIKDKEGKITQTVSRGEEITIVADDKSFSLVVYASKKNQDWVGSLIRQLDKKRPQVLIDVTLVEITHTDQFDYELKMAAGTSRFTSGPNTSPFQVPIINRQAGGLHTTEVGTGPNQGGSLFGGGQFFYSDKNIQVLLQAVQQKSYGRVLAKPKILVNDNEEGKISTTQTTYVAQETVQVPTTGSAITSQTFQAYDAKIELTIKPHISEGDLLLLEVKMTREDFVLAGSTQGAPPNKTASNVDSKVLVPDGATIILGGMIKLNQTKGGSKVPILGDLPLIGALFRGIHDSDDGSKLYIFVKAYALRPVEGVKGLPQAEAISKENQDAFEKAQKTFQRYPNMPGTKPKPMEPNDVLEEL
jgi:general secretion pathway protein D